MTLREKQSLFAKLVGILICYATARGWDLTFSDFYRGDLDGHMPGSLHYDRLAADMNLFVGGRWMQSDCPEWQTLGSVWKSLDPLCAWGGDFGDFNHISLADRGRK